MCTNGPNEERVQMERVAEVLRASSVVQCNYLLHFATDQVSIAALSASWNKSTYANDGKVNAIDILLTGLKKLVKRVNYNFK